MNQTLTEKSETLDNTPIEVTFYDADFDEEEDLLLVVTALSRPLFFELVFAVFIPEVVETESVSSIRSLPYNVFSKSTSSFSIRFCSFTMALSVGQYCDKVRFCRLVVL